MERLHDRVAGIDISRDFADVHFRVVEDGNVIKRNAVRFSTMTADLVRLGDALVAAGINLVVMEATGIYWRSAYYALESVIPEVWVVNAQHVKNVPGRKTDMKDAEWLADVAAHGMVRPSFVPPRPIREVRELTRFRTSLVQERSRALNRIEKMLQDAGIKVSSVASKTLGVSTRAMFELLIGGERDPAKLAECAKGRMRPKIAELTQALVGHFGEHHGLVIRQILAQLDLLDNHIVELESEIDKRLEPYREAKTLLMTAPGVGERVAEVVIAETGADMSKFPTSKHFAAWAGLAPGNAESGGKKRKVATRKGAPQLRTIMIQAAWAAVKTKGSYYGAMYGRIMKRRGAGIAIVAVARKLLMNVWHMLSTGKAHHDLGADYYQRKENPEKVTRKLVAKLNELGHDVVLTPAVNI